MFFGQFRSLRQRKRRSPTDGVLETRSTYTHIYAIANQEDVNRWPYLKGIELLQIEAEIGLLIGSEVPEALQPNETRESKNGGPFTTRTKLGWVINGPRGRDKPKVPSANFIQADSTGSAVSRILQLRVQRLVL